MKEREVREILTGRGPGLCGTACWLVRRVLAAPYAGLMRLRRWAYRRGLLGSSSADVPVICVGNITTGGTGKTPMVVWVVEQLKGLGLAPAILTRGYKAKAGLSDEAELLKRLTGVAVVIDGDRVAGAAAAVADGADVLVMDDGFQHRRLRRDLDIVLIDACNPFGGGCCLPVGRLREPLSALAHAHAVVITRADVAREQVLAALGEKLRRLAPQASIHTAAHAPARIIDHNGEELPIEALLGRKVFSFCGLGNPGAFAATLSMLGAEQAGTCFLEDHAEYPPTLLANLAATAGEEGAEVMVTTAKDRVKIAAPAELPMPLWTLEVQMRILDGEAELLARIAGVGRG